MKPEAPFTGISTGCFSYRMEVEDTVHILPEHGVRNAELFLCTYCEYTEDFAYMLLDRATRSGLRIHAVHPMGLQFEPQLFSPHPRQKEEALRLYEQVLRAGQILGADLYVMHGFPTIPGTGALRGLDTSASVILELARIAESYGITLAYENVSWCAFSTPDFGKSLADRLGDKIHFTLDIKQCYRSGFTPEDYFSAVGPLIRNVHLCDRLPADNGGNLWVLPGKGVVPFRELFERLKGLSYAGPLTLEVYSNAYRSYDELFESYRFIQELADSVFNPSDI